MTTSTAPSLSTSPAAPGARRLRGLWIARELPFPLDTGDRIYSARLMKSVADAGAQLTVTGFPAPEGVTPPADWPITWRTVAGPRSSKLRALFSTMPLVAGTHATSAYRQLVETLAREPWDFVVIDQYGMGWALPYFDRLPPAQRPVRVHIAHDHEASVYASLVREFRGSPLKRAVLWQNGLKTAAFERGIARRVDLLTVITDEDGERFALDAPQTPRVVLTPGYSGAVGLPRQITDDVPRHVVMVGSYHWVAKQENLRRFVRAADARFAEAGITLHVIGAMPPALADELRASSRASVLHGFVDDIAPHFANARLAAVPEEIGGGFKLKFLDYIFGHVPVATLAHAAAGLPRSVRQSLVCSASIETLVDDIVATIGDVPRLDTLQREAYAAAQAGYRWEDRGQALLAAVRAQQPDAAAFPAADRPAFAPPHP